MAWRSGRVNFGGRPPVYFGARESNPSALRLWVTSRARSSEVKAILAMAGTSMAWADHSTIWALRHRTTDPEPRRTMPSSLLPSALVILTDLHTFGHHPSLRDLVRQMVDAPPSTLAVTALVTLPSLLERNARASSSHVFALFEDETSWTSD